MAKSSTPSPQSDPLRDPIYLAVGRAIENWSWVETNLALLLKAMIRSPGRRLVGPAFHAVTNFRDKLKVVDEVATRTLSGKRLSNWNTLKNKISRKSERRNQIAHFSTVIHGKSAPLEARLHPYWAITKWTSAAKGDGFTAADIENLAKAFIDLSQEILRFHHTLPKRLRRP